MIKGKAYPLHTGCADPCNFPKCGKPDCIICGSGELCSHSPLGEKKILVDAQIRL